LDNELVSSSLFTSEESEHQKVRSPLSTYTEQFYEAFPYYLSIGMTYEQFWDGDPMLCKYYREAEEIRNEKKNQELWLQGMYIYEALADISPVLHAFAKKGTKPQPYTETPYAITKKQRDRIKAEKEKQEFEKGKRFMEALLQQTNKKFEEVK
jgi:hypothetical protein